MFGSLMSFRRPRTQRVPSLNCMRLPGKRSPTSTQRNQFANSRLPEQSRSPMPPYGPRPEIRFAAFHFASGAASSESSTSWSSSGGCLTREGVAEREEEVISVSHLRRRREMRTVCNSALNKFQWSMVTRSASAYERARPSPSMRYSGRAMTARRVLK